MSIITLTTDLGTTDFYLAAVKGSILSAMPDATIVDISHHIPPYQIIQAAFLLSNAYYHFPLETVHLVSIDNSYQSDAKFVALKDTIINDQRVSMNRKQNVYFSYGSNWLLIYHGDKFTQTLSHVVNAKHNEIPPKWRDYLNNHLKTKSSISVYASFKELHDYGVSSLNATISNDSNSVTINASLYQKDTIAFKLKNKGYV